MSFDNDIFISYAHLDNLPVIRGENGWVSGFNEALLALLAGYLGKRPKIWRDAKLQGSGIFGNEIIQQLEKAAVLVSILSPPYVTSDWCQREIQTFYEKALAQAVACSVDQRMFKGVKYPLDENQEEPEMLRELLGYQFYKVDPVTEKARDIRPEFGQEMREEYLQRIADLAVEITHRLKHLANHREDSSKQEETELTGIVYLAETTSDLEIQRNNIRRELEQLGYRVLPDSPLPYDTNLCGEIEDYLKQCSLSIHLVGERYGIVPEGKDESVVELQHTLAKKQSQENADFQRVVWLPTGLQVKEARQTAFIEHLQNDTDLLQMGLEKLKTVVQDKLTQARSVSVVESGLSGPIRIYLICDQADGDVIESVDNYLFEQGYEVILPEFDEDEAQVRKFHEENVSDCHVVLIYYGAGDRRWLREQLQYLQRIERYGERPSPLLGKGVLVSDPKTSEKERFGTHEAEVIRNYGEFDPATLAPFVSQISQKQGGEAE